LSGRLIVIEGLDGSGKATQTKLLFDRLCADNEKVMTLSFPCYDDEWSAPVRMYLGGEFGDKPGDVNGYAASVLFAVDRFASYRKDWHRQYNDGYILLSDRYTTSNAVYQAGKLDHDRWNEYLDWLFDFEYKLMGIPKPDAVIFLDVSAETSGALMQKRYVGDETKKDIHERDLEFQRKSREAALYCANKQGWRVVQCDESGVMRNPEDIANDVFDAVHDLI